MKTNSKAISFVSLLALIASVILAVGIKTEPVAALSNCDAAQFVSDVTVPMAREFTGE